MTENTTYKAEQTLAKGYVTVHFVDPFSGKIEVTKKKDAAVLYNPEGTSQGIPTGSGLDTINAEISNKAAGSLVWFRLPDVSETTTMKVIPYDKAASAKTFAWDTVDFATENIWFSFTNEGDFNVVKQNTAPDKTVTYVKFIVQDSPTNGKILGGSCLTERYGVFSVGGADYISATNTDTKEFSVITGTTAVLRTNVTFRTSSGGLIKINNDGSGTAENPKLIYIYKNYKGNYELSTEPAETFTTLRFHFLEQPSPANVTFTGSGTLFDPYDSSSPETYSTSKTMFNGKIGAGASDVYCKIFTDVTYEIEGNSFTQANVGGTDDVHIWYYGGNIYTGDDAEKEAKAAQKAANAGNLSPTDYNGPEPASESSTLLYAIDVPAGSSFRVMYIPLYNGTAKLYEASSGREITINNSNADISAYSGKDTRYFLRVTNIPDWASAGNPALTVYLRTGEWVENGQKGIISNTSNLKNEYGKVYIASAN